MKVIALNEETKLATVELFGKTRELSFYRYQNEDRITIYGFAIRYSQGQKIWHASVCYWPATGKFSQVNPPMDHRNRWAHVTLVGFYEDVPEQYRSKR